MLDALRSSLAITLIREIRAIRDRLRVLLGLHKTGFLPRNWDFEGQTPSSYFVIFVHFVVKLSCTSW